MEAIVSRVKMRWFAWTTLAAALLVVGQDGARGFMTTRLPMARLGLKHVTAERVRRIRMCADDGRRSLDDELRVIDPSAREDKAKGGGAPAQNDRLEDSTRKTEMWKELWMRNVANADTSRKHTSQFFSDSVNSLRTRLFRRWFSPNDHYEEVMFHPTRPVHDTSTQKKIIGAKDVITCMYVFIKFMLPRTRAFLGSTSKEVHQSCAVLMWSRPTRPPS